MAAARKRDARAHNALMTAHYLSASLPHMKNPPPLKKLLVDVEAKPRQPMDWRQIKAALQVALVPGEVKHGGQ